MASKVPDDVNVPLAIEGQVSVGDKIVTPGPAIVDANMLAG